jgi:hypothetical protein
VSRFNPDTKRFINTCSACGRQGYTPQILEPDFVTDLVKRTMRDVLLKNYEALPVNEHSLCAECQRALEMK